MIGLRFGLKVSTNKSLEAMEGWLAGHCAGHWRLDIDGISPDLRTKTVAVLFQNEDDKLRFKQQFRQI